MICVSVFRRGRFETCPAAEAGGSETRPYNK